MIETFLSPFLFSTLVPNHQSIKEEFLPSIKSTLELNKDLYLKNKKNSGWNSNVYTSFDYELKFLSDKSFMKSVVWDPLDKFLDEAKGKRILRNHPSSFRCDSIWFNYYETGGFQEVHDHLNGDDCLYSGIYLMHLDCPNTTAFLSRHANIFLTETKTTEKYPEGTVLIFPSELLHYVNPVEKTKYTISFNIK
jgi:hypothetical protein